MHHTWKCKTQKKVQDSQHTRHITKEGKKKEHKKIQDFGDTKKLTTHVRMQNSKESLRFTTQQI